MLVNMISSIPRFRSAGLCLEGIKRTGTDSMMLMFKISRLCFSRIRGLPGVEEICENEPVDYSWALGITRAISFRG